MPLAKSHMQHMQLLDDFSKIYSYIAIFSLIMFNYITNYS